MPASPSLPIPAVAEHCGELATPDPVQLAPSLRTVLAGVVDPRARRGVRHGLVTVLAAAVCAVQAGARSYVAIAEWVADLPAEVAAALGVVRAPCESTIRRVVQSVDADRFDRAIGTWIQNRCAGLTPGGRRRVIAVDGKAVRGARARGDGRARHLLGAVDHHARVVLGQVDVDGKTNEITRFAPLLDTIDIAGAVVTADALHTQREHVDYLAARGAHWMLTVKGNQPKLRQQLAALPWREVEVGHRSTENSHGRRAIRTLKVVSIAAGIDFPHATQAIQITRKTRPLRRRGRWHTETVYAITDLPPQHVRPDELAAWLRGHWQIENALHWVRDVTYAEDHSQVRTGHGPQVMASLRNLAISVLRLGGATNIASGLRHHARDVTRPLAVLGLT